jgi:hypothetical protein
MIACKISNLRTISATTTPTHPFLKAWYLSKLTGIRKLGTWFDVFLDNPETMNKKDSEMLRGIAAFPEAGGDFISLVFNISSACWDNSSVSTSEQKLRTICYDLEDLEHLPRRNLNRRTNTPICRRLKRLNHGRGCWYRVSGSSLACGIWLALGASTRHRLYSVLSVGLSTPSMWNTAISFTS